MSTSMFSSVQQAPPIEVFELTQKYRNDTFEKKVDLGVGGEFFFIFHPLSQLWPLAPI